ncbi:hypothetical protein AAMO2058_000041600 [Amorphochlora amoebiformis]
MLGGNKGVTGELILNDKGESEQKSISTVKEDAIPAKISAPASSILLGAKRQRTPGPHDAKDPSALRDKANVVLGGGAEGAGGRGLGDSLLGIQPAKKPKLEVASAPAATEPSGPLDNADGVSKPDFAPPGQSSVSSAAAVMMNMGPGSSLPPSNPTNIGPSKNDTNEKPLPTMPPNNLNPSSSPSSSPRTGLEAGSNGPSRRKPVNFNSSQALPQGAQHTDTKPSESVLASMGAVSGREGASLLMAATGGIPAPMETEYSGASLTGSPGSNPGMPIVGGTNNMVLDPQNLPRGSVRQATVLKSGGPTGPRGPHQAQQAPIMPVGRGVASHRISHRSAMSDHMAGQAAAAALASAVGIARGKQTDLGGLGPQTRSQRIVKALDTDPPSGLMVYVPGGAMPPLGPFLHRLIEVRVPATYLTSNGYEIMTRKLWGSPKAYTDDSDVVAMLLHSGKFPVRGSPPRGIAGVSVILRVSEGELSYPSIRLHGLLSRKWPTPSTQCALSIVRTGTIGLSEEDMFVFKPRRGRESRDIHRTNPSRARIVFMSPPEKSYSKYTIKHLNRVKNISDHVFCFTPDGEVGCRSILAEIRDRPPSHTPTGLTSGEWTFSRFAKEVLYIGTDDGEYELKREEDSKKSGGSATYRLAKGINLSHPEVKLKPKRRLRGRDHRVSMGYERSVPLDEKSVIVIQSGLEWEDIEWHPSKVTFGSRVLEPKFIKFRTINRVDT